MQTLIQKYNSLFPIYKEWCSITHDVMAKTPMNLRDDTFIVVRVYGMEFKNDELEVYCSVIKNGGAPQVKTFKLHEFTDESEDMHLEIANNKIILEVELDKIKEQIEKAYVNYYVENIELGDIAKVNSVMFGKGIYLVTDNFSGTIESYRIIKKNP